MSAIQELKTCGDPDVDQEISGLKPRLSRWTPSLKLTFSQKMDGWKMKFNEIYFGARPIFQGRADYFWKVIIISQMIWRENKFNLFNSQLLQPIANLVVFVKELDCLISRRLLPLRCWHHSMQALRETKARETSGHRCHRFIYGAMPGIAMPCHTGSLEGKTTYGFPCNRRGNPRIYIIYIYFFLL